MESSDVIRMVERATPHGQAPVPEEEIEYAQTRMRYAQSHNQYWEAANLAADMYKAQESLPPGEHLESWAQRRAGKHREDWDWFCNTGWLAGFVFRLLSITPKTRLRERRLTWKEVTSVAYGIRPPPNTSLLAEGLALICLILTSIFGFMGFFALVLFERTRGFNLGFQMAVGTVSTSLVIAIVGRNSLAVLDTWRILFLEWTETRMNRPFTLPETIDGLAKIMDEVLSVTTGMDTVRLTDCASLMMAWVDANYMLECSKSVVISIIPRHPDPLVRVGELRDRHGFDNCLNLACSNSRGSVRRTKLVVIVKDAFLSCWAEHRGVMKKAELGRVEDADLSEHFQWKENMLEVGNRGRLVPDRRWLNPEPDVRTFGDVAVAGPNPECCENSLHAQLPHALAELRTGEVFGTCRLAATTKRRERALVAEHNTPLVEILGLCHRTFSHDIKLRDRTGLMKMFDCKERRQVPWMSNEEYIAMSYTWKEYEDRQDLENKICAAAAAIGVNYAWCDQICIDQSKPEQVAIQLPMMPDIYKEAAATVVLTREVSLTTSVRAIFRGKTMSAEGRNKARQLVGQVMKSKWAERMWTLQEAVWSNSLLVFTGEAIFDLRGVHHLGEARLNEDIAGDWAGPNGVLSELRRRCNDTILADRALVSTWAEPWECVPTLAENIDTLLEVAAHRQCARPNDKIYALLGLTKHNDFWITYNESVESTLVRAINAGVVSWPVLTMVKTEEGSQNCWMPNLKEAVRVPEANSSIRTIDMVEQMIKLDGFIADTEELKSQVEIPDSHPSNQILLVVPGIGGTDSLAMRAEVVKDRVLHRTGAWRIKMSEELKNAHQEEIGTYLVGATLLQA